MGNYGIMGNAGFRSAAVDIVTGLHLRRLWSLRILWTLHLPSVARYIPAIYKRGLNKKTPTLFLGVASLFT